MLALADLIRGYPLAKTVSASEVAQLVVASGRKLVVLDDDPTGTQSVADLPVLTGWSTADLIWALNQGKPAVYVMTNTRSLDPCDAAQRNRDVVAATMRASRATGIAVDFVSRSDSTLRGHYPLETDTIIECLAAEGAPPIDAVVIVPAFGEAGRITVGGVHYAGSDSAGFLPVGETEFARDATFGYQSSDLRDWVAEKTEGRFSPSEVVVLTLDILRSGPAAVAAFLQPLKSGQPAVVDIVEENDLRILALGLDRAEGAGKHFLYRVGPPFVRARIGQEIHEPLGSGELASIRTEGAANRTIGGLVVVGSHVARTTEQLTVLRKRRSPIEIEIDVTAVLDIDRRDQHLATVVHRAVDGLNRDNVILRTSRTVITGRDGETSLSISRQISSAVVETVQSIVALRKPQFVIAKGGITSSDVATRGLAISRAIVRGPMLPGIISLWEPCEGPAQGIPYVVFAGNVGDEQSLVDVVDKLSILAPLGEHTSV